MKIQNLCLVFVLHKFFFSHFAISPPQKKITNVATWCLKLAFQFSSLVDSAGTVVTLQRQCQQYRCLLWINNRHLWVKFNFKHRYNSKITRLDNPDIDVLIGRNALIVLMSCRMNKFIFDESLCRNFWTKFKLTFLTEKNENSKSVLIILPRVSYFFCFLHFAIFPPKKFTNVATWCLKLAFQFSSLVDSAGTVVTLQRQCQQYRCLLCINIDTCGLN